MTIGNVEPLVVVLNALGILAVFGVLVWALMQVFVLLGKTGRLEQRVDDLERKLAALKIAD